MYLQIMPNETTEQFAIRAHREILANPASDDRLRDYETRNQYVWEAIRDQRGFDPEKVMDQKLKPTKYTKDTDRCFFMEHERIGRDGLPKRYAAEDMADICQHTNNRAVKTHKFTALSKDHTPSDPNGVDPPHMGYAGNFRVGMINNEQFGIWGDEYYRKGLEGVCEGMPQRSVELITRKDTGERYLDPIAMLSTKTPRLPLPIKYSIEEREHVEKGDLVVEKYSIHSPEIERNSMMGAPTFPGGSNTQQYGAMPSTDPQESASQSMMMLEGHPVIQQLKDLLPSLQRMVEQSTQSEFPDLAPQPEPVAPQMPPQGMPQEPPQGMPQAMPEQAMPEQSPQVEKNIAPLLMGAARVAAPMIAGAMSQPEQNSFYSAEEDDDMDAERYAEMQSQLETVTDRIGELEHENRFLAERVAEREAYAEMVEENSTRSHRASYLKELHEKHGDQIFALEDTLDRFAGESLANEDVWDVFRDQIERNSELLDNSAATRMPSGSMPRSGGKMDPKMVQSRANKLLIEAQRNGSYDFQSSAAANVQKYMEMAEKEFG